MLARLSCVLALFLCGVLSANAWAHRLGESYVYLNVTDEALTGRFEVTLADVDRFVPLETDGALTMAAFDAKAPAVYAYLQPRLVFYADGRRYPVEITGHGSLDTEVGTFSQTDFVVPGLSPVPDVIEVDYTPLFADSDPDHLGLLLIESNTRTGQADNESFVSLVFGPDTGRQSLQLTGAPWQATLPAFIGYGMMHVLSGVEHLLFLAVLLLPAVMVRDGDRWAPGSEPQSALLMPIAAVSLFSLAQALSLGLATLSGIALPFRLIEWVMALAIAALAVNNVRPWLGRRVWPLLALMGLVHGGSFDVLLAPLGVTPHDQVPALIGFSLGVELGQVIAILVVFPVLFALRRWVLYRPLVLHTGSAALAAVALLWISERTFDMLGPVKDNLLALIS